MWKQIEGINMGLTKFFDDVMNRLEELEEEEKKKVYCSECSTLNTIYDNYCGVCGHKLKKINEKDKVYKVYCTECGEKLNKDDKFCTECGCEVSEKIPKERICAVCGEWCGYEEYCRNCGHNNIKNSSWVKYKGEKNLIKFMFKPIDEKEYINLRLVKKCPNCHSEFQRYFNYCERCGTKLDKK